MQAPDRATDPELRFRAQNNYYVLRYDAPSNCYAVVADRVGRLVARPTNIRIGVGQANKRDEQ